jgi:hypothetical protein
MRGRIKEKEKEKEKEGTLKERFLHGCKQDE